MSAAGAVALLVTRLARHLSWVLVGGLLLGLAAEGRSLMAGRLSPERRLYLALVLLSLAGATTFVILRGETVGDRNLLFAFMLAIPMSLRPAARYLSTLGRRQRWAIIAVALTCSLGWSWRTGQLETRWVTGAKPQAIIWFGEWARQSTWRDRSVVFTRMDWQPTYFPYYFPSHASKTLIVSEWIDDAELRDLVQLAQPALLVTQRGDEAYVERFARVTGMAVEPARLVQRHGEIEVYELIRALPRQ